MPSFRPREMLIITLVGKDVQGRTRTDFKSSSRPASAEQILRKVYKRININFYAFTKAKKTNIVICMQYRVQHRFRHVICFGLVQNIRCVPLQLLWLIRMRCLQQTTILELTHDYVITTSTRLLPKDLRNSKVTLYRCCNVTWRKTYLYSAVEFCARYRGACLLALYDLAVRQYALHYSVRVLETYSAWRYDDRYDDAVYSVTCRKQWRIQENGGACPLPFQMYTTIFKRGGIWGTW